MIPFGSTKKKAFTPQEAMGLAILEGHKGAGFVAPNPQVGCVILDEDNLLLSANHHKVYGGPHAEIEALKGVSEEQLQGAHVFVTLEPCAHEGKTPSCAKRLAELPIESVTYGLIDPNPLVSGKGIEILERAGKIVKAYDGFQEELSALAEVFLHNMKEKKPFVALKVASSLDGQMGLKSGDSKWITNEKSRTYAHYLRGVYDAILVGRRTVEIDNPSLNIRHADFSKKENKVVIMDPNGDLIANLSTLNILKTHDPKQIYLVVAKKHEADVSKHALGVHVIGADFDETRGFNLDQLLRDLFALGISSILLEGGAYVYQTFLRQNQIQRLYTFLAPIIIGAEKGLSWTSSFGIDSLNERIKLEHIHTYFFDNDVLVTGRINL